MKQSNLDEVTVLFAGDSGDGMQLTGNQFTETVAIFGNDISTLPDFPAEIRAPSGSLAGVSGYQVHFGGVEINSPGDLCDVLVVMNAAALRKNVEKLKENGIIILNTSGFDAKNLRISGYRESPLKSLKEKFSVHEIDIKAQTTEILKEYPSLSQKEKDRTKNMFALGFVYWLFSKEIGYTEGFIEQKFTKQDQIKDANLAVLRAGYKFGEIVEVFTERYRVKKAEKPQGLYRNISGNEAIALGFLCAAQKSGLQLFYAGYPITPASDILHHLSKYSPIGVKTLQAEDEISSITSLIGASYAGNLAVTGTSGPGMALKIEGLGLGFILELPMVIVNVQRGGPSTGLPTKTEQADLMQAIYGRNGEAPIPVIAAKSPSDCFNSAFEAAKMALEFSTPVILLSDGYLGNGREPWLIPNFDDLPEIKTSYLREKTKDKYYPYQRRENLSRKIAVPGTEGMQHIIGGLEKNELTGHVSYEAENHQKMVKTRNKKFHNTRETYLPISFDQGKEDAQILVLSWGSTYGSIRDAVKRLLDKDYPVAHVHLRNVNPLPKDLGEILKDFKHIIVPEINNGQLIRLIRDQYLVNAEGFNKIKGTPFLSSEIEQMLISKFEKISV